MTLRTWIYIEISQEVWLTSARPLHVPLYRFRNEYAVKLVPLTRERHQEALSFILRERTGSLILLIEEKYIPRGNSLLKLSRLPFLFLPCYPCYLMLFNVHAGKCSFKLLHENNDLFFHFLIVFYFILNVYLFDSLDYTLFEITWDNSG